MGLFEDMKGLAVTSPAAIPANATVMGATDTGQRLRDAPVMDVELEVRIPDQEPYAVTRRMAIARAGLDNWCPGRVWPVQVDPSDRSRLIID